jgi:uracil-DNA glycosylase family 4
MPDTPDPQTRLARQVKLHLESLRAAGVEFLPVAAPQAESPGAYAPGSPSIAVPAVAGLFDEPEAPIPDTPDGRRHELAVLAERVSGCPRCPELYSTRTQTVFGVGPIDPDVCFVGEAPGADEDATGEPFVGRAGQLLNRIIAACGFKRDEVYICNTIKCRPPNNRTPTPEETANCREYFDRQLALVRPKYIVCLGATAAKNVLGTSLGIMKLRGKLYKYKDIPVVCTFHPAALLRNEAWKKDTWEDMKFLLRTMGRPIPGAKS